MRAQGLKLMRNHVLCGRSAGYAWCCIGWFLALWFLYPTYWYQKPLVFRVSKTLGEPVKVWLRAFTPKGVQYVLCPLHCVLERVLGRRVRS